MPKRVLVQAGHNPPREPGFEAGTGTAGEIDYTKDMADKVLALLANDSRFNGIYAPGDIPNGIKVDAAIFLHCDGSANPAVSGYSFGFPSDPVNAKLAKLIGEEFNEIDGHPPHHTDNYTADLHGYYGFSRVDTQGPEVLIEHGFLTNPKEREWLLSHKNELARAEYTALCRYFGMAPRALRVKAWHVSYLNGKGDRVMGRTKDIDAWTKAHPGAFQRGKVNITPDRT